MASKDQWLVDPADARTPMYITDRFDVAQRRANKGDYVVQLERAGVAAERPDYRPYYKRVRPINKPVAVLEQKPQATEDEDEL